MAHLAVIQLMRVIKWARSDSDGSCVKINVRGNKGFYSILPYMLFCIIIKHFEYLMDPSGSLKVNDHDHNILILLLIYQVFVSILFSNHLKYVHAVLC